MTRLEARCLVNGIWKNSFQLFGKAAKAFDKGYFNGYINPMWFMFEAMTTAPRKINMEPQNGGLEDYFPFQLDDF